MFRGNTSLIALFITSLTLTAFSGPFQAAQQRRGVAWWVWVLIILILVALLIWWWLGRRRAEEKAMPTSKAEPVAPARVAETPVPTPSPQPPVAAAPAQPTLSAETPPAAPPAPDDLTVIEGIGPKISGLLKAAGILTFAQLATTDLSQLKQILDEARLTVLADPTTWPEQAGLAAEGKWNALQQLQDQLKRGRRM
jgi:predicted flap endonuclease-1-like 5' DNA nuclease